MVPSWMHQGGMLQSLASLVSRNGCRLELPQRRMEERDGVMSRTELVASFYSNSHLKNKIGIWEASVADTSGHCL